MNLLDFGLQNLWLIKNIIMTKHHKDQGDSYYDLIHKCEFISLRLYRIVYVAE